MSDGRLCEMAREIDDAGERLTTANRKLLCGVREALRDITKIRARINADLEEVEP